MSSYAKTGENETDALQNDMVGSEENDSPTVDRSELSDLDSEEGRNVKRCFKCSCRKLCAFLLIVMLAICFLIIIYFSTWKSDTVDTSARVFHGSNNHRRTCDNIYDEDNSIFGCCEITDEHNDVYKLSLYRIVKRNEAGTNCPTYTSLLNEMKKYLNKYKDYFQDEYGKPRENPCIKDGVTLPVDKCPETWEVIDAYNHYYRDPRPEYWLLCIILLAGACLCANS